jgi:choloylglycine hydrolase
MRNVSQPFSEIDLKAIVSGQPHNSPTRWRTVIDLTNGNFYYESTLSPNIIWVNFKELDFSTASGLRKMDLQEDNLIGDSTKGFKPAKGFSVLKPE